MAMIDEGEDLIETGEEVVAKVKQFLQSGSAGRKDLNEPSARNKLAMF